MSDSAVENGRSGPRVERSLDSPTWRSPARRFTTLDGLRGFAAVAVALCHIQQFYAFGNLVPAGYLAVDLFFVLSGFVIAKSYNPRFEKGMRLVAFLRARVTRLYPLYGLAMITGFVAVGASLAMGHGDYSHRVFAVATAAAVVMIPSPTWGGCPWISPIDGPAWSLYFELAVNVVFAFGWRQLTTPMLIAIVAIAGAAMAGTIIYFGSADVGWTWHTFFGGFPRVTFSFFAGVLLARVQRARPVSSAWVWLLVAIALATMLTPTGHRTAFDLCAVLVLMPLLVWVGAHLELADARIFLLLGDASYGLYVMHYPVLALTVHATNALHITRAWWGGLILILALVPFSVLLERWYDRPVRAWLSGASRRASAATPVSVR